MTGRRARSRKETGGRDREYVRIPQGATAEVWMITSSATRQPRVVSFHCPTCPDSDNSRLVDIRIRPEPRLGRPVTGGSLREKPARLLLHVTRQQIEQILSDFGNHGNASTLMDIARHTAL